MKKMENIKYIVKKVVEESHSVSTLWLELIDGGLPEYVAGQFITVYFPESVVSEGKSYSISTAPIENNFCITVKDVGIFSHYLCEMKVGDVLEASLPYGYFYTDSKETPIVLCAGGIGITPLRSLIIDTLKNNANRSVYLFYSVRKINELVFKKEFDDLKDRYKNFNVNYFVTRDDDVGKDIFKHRMGVKNIVEVVTKVSEAEFFLCGSISFVRDLWRGFKAEGVKEESMYTEAFFSH
jgi:ferredoxin-NADP reductase